MIEVMATQQVPLDPLAVRNKADWLWLALRLQYDRLMDRVPRGRHPSALEGAQISNEFDFYINAANRLLRLAELAASKGVGGEALREAVQTFTTAAPAVRAVRDTAEHFDEYSLGKGLRQRHGEPISGFVFTVFVDEVLVTFADFRLPVQLTTRAAEQLHGAIRGAVDAASRDDPSWDEPLVELGARVAG